VAGKLCCDQLFCLKGSDGSKVSITCEMLWSEEIADLGGPPNNYRPKPVTSETATVSRDVVIATASSSSTLDAMTRQQSSQVGTSGDHNSKGYDYESTLNDRRRDDDDAMPKENEFRLHDVEVLSAQPWLPWPDEDEEGELEADNMTVASRLSTSVERVAADDLQQSTANNERRRKEDIDLATVYTRSRESTTPGQTFYHRGQLVEHRVQENYSHDHWLGFDEMRKSAAAFIGEGSEIFENHDFSRARKSLKLNVDEGLFVFMFDLHD